MGTHDLLYTLGPAVLMLWVYISSKPLVPMLQLHLSDVCMFYETNVCLQKCPFICIRKHFPFIFVDDI